MDTERLWILLAKKKNGETSAEECAELELLLSQKNISGYNYEVIEKLWEEPLGFLPEMELPETTWNNIETKLNTHKKIVFHTIMKRWMAAAILLMAVSTIVFLYYKTPAKNNDISSLKNTNLVVTKPALKRNFYLPDGSHVWLNGNSRITYASNGFGTAKREVNLTGEAFFDVVKNPAVPFIIHAGVVNIMVKGTAFNVKAYPGQKNIETTLLRGLIEITTAQNPGKKIYVKPNEKIIIPVNVVPIKSKMFKETATDFTITPIQNNAYKILAETAWMKDRLEFNNETFEALAPEMESWFSVEIDFTNNAIKSKRFSGVIEKETLEQTLKALQLSYPFNYEINNNVVTIQ